ncbi:hypothetical protein CNYM01_04368 [Colletotrichum nymphaeae SA-01]|uniref:Uncharacterized protein n=1 Tax=Colletotrichum nymphaeae SA-01 TaxID=1460502 RepID=A0A135TKE3_9PEZI|nr:hypothetical protein CNYM01_04368 [Colletotrichum nymphaeae SA-01]
MPIITNLTHLITKLVITNLIEGAKLSHNVPLACIYTILTHKVTDSISSHKPHKSKYRYHGYGEEYQEDRADDE